MSAKCEYSSKYKPLVVAKRLQLNNEDAFQQWVDNTFTNPDLARVGTGDAFSGALNISAVKIADAAQKVDSVKVHFRRSADYNRCVRSYLDALIESAIYNKNSNEWIDAEGKTESDQKFDNLNTNIFEYKRSLINRICRYFGKSTFDDSIDSENIDLALTNAISQALAYVDLEPNGSVTNDVYEAYVILKNFNRLMEERAPFIRLRKEYEGTTWHGANMYVYQGPSVKHRVSWTTNEHISAESQYSDLAKILLDYFPEIGKNKIRIDGTAIGVAGFTSIMAKFWTALMFSDKMSVHRTKYCTSGFDMEEALTSYLQLVESSTGSDYNRTQITTQLGKLRGIIHYIYESNLSDDVKEMFTGMMMKTVPLTYRAYTWKNGAFGGQNLIDSYVLTESLNQQDIVSGRVSQFRSNTNLWKDLTKTWGIKVDLKNDVITISKLGVEIRGIKPKPKKGSGSYIEFNPSLSGIPDFENFQDFVTSLFGQYIPLDAYDNLSRNVNPHKNIYGVYSAVIEDFLPLLTIILAASDLRTTTNEFPPLSYTGDLNFKTWHLFDSFSNVATTLSLMYGQETRTVVNDMNNNHLPTTGLTSLIFNAPKIAIQLMEESNGDKDNPFVWSPIMPQKDTTNKTYGVPGFLAPLIRQGVKIGNQTKDVSQLTLSELLEVSVVYDFLDSLTSGGPILLQNTNFSDKTRQFIIPFLAQNITIEGKDYNMRELIKNVSQGKSDAQEKLIEVWQKTRKKRYEIISRNILKDYAKVLGKEFGSLKDLDAELEKRRYSIDKLRSMFRSYVDPETKKQGINFDEDLTAQDVTYGYARVNTTLLHFNDTFADIKSAKKRLTKSRAFFADDLFKSRTKINRFTNPIISQQWDSISSDWKEKRGTVETGNLILFKVYDKSGNEIKVDASNPQVITNPKYNVVLNPIFEAYLLSDIIYSNEFNFICVGDVFSHPTKVKWNVEDDDVIAEWGSSRFQDKVEASQLIAQNKRAVIYGSTIHSFSHDLKDNRGVAKRIDIAVMEDMPAFVWNMLGGIKDKFIDDEIDSMDGSGIQSIYEAILEQESLKDAAAGLDEKTILGWNDKYTGRQILLKWAVYALTNERRRMSRNSTASGELLFKKLHSRQFEEPLDIEEIYNQFATDSIYFKNFDSRKIYKVVGLHNENGVYARQVIEVDKNGNAIDLDVYDQPVIHYATNRNTIVDSIENPADFSYNTLYDLDQFFGGAYEMSMQDGELQYSSKGNHIVADIICKYDLKKYFIAYVVNKSAVKAGARNLNNVKRWTDDKELDTMEMSTEFGGLQMNAEHELDDSEVSEMTQMISALMEKGFNLDLVKRIYEDIGDVVMESLKKFKTAIKTAPQDLKVIFGQALIEAYAKGDRDTLGLAQAFLARAERMLRDKDIDFKFPFSGATINGSFIATVASIFTKRGIRRKYAGVAAVLTPSYNMIQVFSGGRSLDAYADWISEDKKNLENKNGWGTSYENASVDQMINDVWVQDDTGITRLNPYIQSDPQRNFTFEDTIVLTDTNSTTGEIVVKDVIVIDSYEKYDYYKHTYNGNISVWTSRPRNLRGSDTTFKVAGKTYSVHDLMSVRAANYAKLGKFSATTLDVKQANLAAERTKVICDVLDQANVLYRSDIVWQDMSNTDWNALSNAILANDLVVIGKLINIKRTLYNVIQTQLRDISNNHTVRDLAFNGGQKTLLLNVEVSAAEIVMGKLFAKQFGLKAGDDVQSILEQGSNFFYTRISGNYSEPRDVPYDMYDAIAYTESGEQILVKIDPSLEYNFDKTSNPNITVVDGKAYLNEEELTSSDRKQFYQIKGENGQLYNVVVMDSVDSFSDFVTEKQISNFKINYRNNPDLAVELTIETAESSDYEVEYDGKLYAGNYFDDLANNTSKDILAQIMKLSEDQNFEKRLQKQAKRMAESFKLSLNFVGTRIPAQAMQSFQPMRIVAFTDSETNDIYVNRDNTYLEGSDYDVDKTYVMGYEVNSDGLIETGSRLARWIGIEAALDLAVAKGRTFIEGPEKTSLHIDNRTLTEALNGNVNVLNQILKSGNTQLSFDELVLTPEQIGNPDYILSKEYQERVDRRQKRIDKLIKMLNIHEHSYVSEAALKNRVLHGIRKVVLDPKNQLNLHSPIAMDEQEAAAKRSELGKAEENINIDTPSAKFMMQEQNMVGKACIGITAVAIKVYFAKSEYYDNLLSTIPAMVYANQDQAVLNMLNSLVFKNPVNGQLTLLANVNLIDVLEKLPKDYLSISAKGDLSIFNDKKTGNFNLRRCLQWLRWQSNRVDCAMELSGLLSAATDNAKALILSKINATSKFIDIYTVALQMGCTFEEISNIMMSPLFSAISRLTNDNIFKGYEKRHYLKDVIDFYLKAHQEGTDRGFLNLSYAQRNLLFSEIAKISGVEPSKVTPELVETWLSDNKALENLIGRMYSGAKNAKSNSYDIDGYLIGGVDRNNALAVANFLEECLDRNLTLERLKKENPVTFNKQIEDLKLVRDIFVPAAEEQNILGAMLGVNQGLKTSGYEQYQLIFRIQNFVSGRIGEDFNLMKFISDAIYRNDMISKYEGKKSFVNVLDVIASVPHFEKMFGLIYDNDFIDKHLSSRYELTQEYAFKLRKDYPLSEREYKQIGYYVNDIYLMTFLTSLNKSFHIPEGVKYYDKGNTRENQFTGSGGVTIKLNSEWSLFGLASFKSYMENYIIPALQQHPEFKDNLFIANLTYSKRINNVTGKKQTFYKLPFNMMTIDYDSTTKSRYDAILNAFTNIASNTFEGERIADLFFIYNAIVNKDAMGKTSMTRIFEDLVDSPNSSTLVSKFYEYLSEIDDSPKAREEFRKAINENDIKFYIKRNVPGTRINSDYTWDDNPDFTFTMPTQLGNWVINQPNVKEYAPSVTSYSYDVSNADIVQTIAQNVFSKYKGSVEIHSQDYFDTKFNDSRKNAPAFIYNGVVYINISKATVTDVLHEYTHIILAAMKNDRKYQDLYYRLLDVIKTHPDYDLIAGWYEDTHVVGRDLDEEVLTKIIQQYFDNKIVESDTTNILRSSEGTILEAIKDVFGIDGNFDLARLTKSSPRTIIMEFASNLFNFGANFDLSENVMRWRTATAALRNILTTGNDPQVEVKCD